MNKTWVFILLGLAGIGMVVVLLADIFGGSPSPKAAPAAVATPLSLPTFVPTPVEWKNYRDDDLHFSFECPITLDVYKPPVGIAKTADMQGHSVGGDLYVRVQAQEVKYEPDLAQELDKQVKTLQSMNETLRNFQATMNPVTIGGAPGLLAEGSAHLPGRTPWEMKLLLIKKDSTLLDMFIQYSPTDEGKATADRVVRSLSFWN